MKRIIKFRTTRSIPKKFVLIIVLDYRSKSKYLICKFKFEMTSGLGYHEWQGRNFRGEIRRNGACVVFVPVSLTFFEICLAYLGN